MNKNKIIVAGVVLPILVAIVNSQIAKNSPLSWSSDNLNSVSYYSNLISLLFSLILIYSNRVEKKLWVWFFAGFFVLLNVVLLILGSFVQNLLP